MRCTRPHRTTTAARASIGDHFTASVKYVDGGTYKLTLTDNTKGWSHTVTKSLSAQNASADHVAATRPVIAELADTDPQHIARQWYEGARAVAAAAARDRSRAVVFHDITVSVDQLLVMRTV